MKDNLPLCIISNDKFTICFKTTNQMFYHLYRLLTQYADESPIDIKKIKFEVTNND